MVRKQQHAVSGKPSRRRRPATISYGGALRRALRAFARADSFANVRLHGNVGWQPMQLVMLAVLWVWSDQPTLTRGFARASRLAEKLFGVTAVTTYQGLCGALRSYTEPLLPQVWSQLHRLMEQSGGPHWRIGKWLPLAVDGSRVDTPRTASNERAFCAPNFGHGTTAKSRKRWKNRRRRMKSAPARSKPHIWLTLIWHMGLKMPWCWKKGPSMASERRHVCDLLTGRDFPQNTLFCGDAGFVGYELWKTILDSGHEFLMRVGGNVRLLRRLGHARQRNDLVHLWPDAVRRKQQPPLVLRLISCRGPRGKIYLVTSVLCERELSLTEAARLYRLRWGVELQFRALKQTFRRRKLRSRTAANALVELDWSLVGLSLIQWLAVKEQIQIEGLPQQSSVALALQIIQDAMSNWSDVLPDRQTLARQLRQAIHDPYQRTSNKQARYRVGYKDPPTTTPPKLLAPTKIQKQTYNHLHAAA